MHPRYLILTAVLPFASFAAEGPSLRLANDVVPTHYSVQLAIAPDSDTFEGSIDIDVTANAAQPVIWLNAVDLDLKSVRNGDQQATVVPGNKGFVGLRFARPVAAGPSRIHIDYTGKISRKSSAGVFELEDNGRWYVYTQFESTDARRAFPCFDQPSFKTPWDIALKVAAGNKAFANTPEILSAPEPDGRSLVRFATTRPLPSYLVAFAVGPFDVIDLGKARKTPLRIILPQGHKGEAEYAAGAIPELVKLLEEYFGMPFPYAKLDSVVMPISNFAMENAGLITYGASMLLGNPARDSIVRQRMCVIVAAHEMAHQWFGDLVTTAWWDDIWLNEAFATWLENKIVARMHPEWHMEAEAAAAMLDVMRQDRLASSRAIRQPIESDDDIANAFDGITYQKGAAVISMFEHWIGEERFRNGVHQYLKENADKSATARQFLTALSKGAGRDIAPAFSSFLDQAGVPVVSVSLECGSGKPQVSLQQSRFVPMGSEARAETWSIPVCIRYEADGKLENECTLLTRPSSELTLTRAKTCPTWVVGNDREAGYYRVEYRGDLLSRLVHGSAPELSTPETVGLLSDAAALIDSGKVSPATALALVPEFASRPEAAVVSATTDIAGYAVRHYVSDEVLPLGRQFIRANYAARAEALGWQSKPGETDDQKLLRSTLVPLAAVSGRDPVLLKQAGELARAWLKNRSAIDPNMVGQVLQAAARAGDAGLFDELLAAAKTTKESRDRIRILSALGSFTDPALVNRALNLLLTGQFDMREGFYTLLFGPLTDRDTERLPFQFIREHIDELIKALPAEVGADFASRLPMVGAPFCDAASLAQVDDFFRDRVKNMTGGPRELAQVLERSGLCVRQKAQLQPALEQYLRAYVKP